MVAMTETERIFAYVRANHVLTVCSTCGSIPWAANCFYAFDGEEATFLFLSDLETRHAAEIRENAAVAGTISSQRSNVAKLRGLQYSGTARLLDGAGETRGREIYYRRFPFARLHAAPLWAIVPEMMKYTDNSLGFGAKLVWRRADV